MRRSIFLLPLVLGMGFIEYAEAASITAYRIYLDTENRTNKFLVRNVSNKPETCEVDFSYLAYDVGGDAKELTNDEYHNFVDSALRSIRYSPRQFNLQPTESQHIAFNFRPTIVEKGEEKRVYMRLKCETPSENNEGTLLQPRLIQQIPIIIRNDRRNELFANISFENVKRFDDGVSFDLAITGSRSSFGNLIAKDEKTGNSQVLNRNIGLYPEMQYRSFAYNLDFEEIDDVVIRFEENTNFGGYQVVNLNLGDIKQ